MRPGYKERTGRGATGGWLSWAWMQATSSVEIEIKIKQNKE